MPAVGRGKKGIFIFQFERQFSAMIHYFYFYNDFAFVLLLVLF